MRRRRGDASREAGGGEAPFVGVGIGRGEREFDATRADANKPGELENLSRIVPQVASANCVCARPTRLSIDLPAAGAQSLRQALSLPASAAISGS